MIPLIMSGEADAAGCILTGLPDGRGPLPLPVKVFQLLYSLNHIYKDHDCSWYYHFNPKPIINGLKMGSGYRVTCQDSVNLLFSYLFIIVQLI